jgi:[lysine-biosynthesis-protein LysW]--L-2-aminoadipate ligase
MSSAFNGASADQPRLGVLVSHLRLEEKLILQAAREKGIEVSSIFDRSFVIDLAAKTAEEAGLAVDVVLDRGVVHSRAAYILKALNRWDIPTVNPPTATTLCDDKALCSLALEEAGLLTPKTMLAFSIDSAIAACEQLGYPAVLKPITGSWGRLLAKVNGPEQAQVILEQKEQLGSYQHGIFYVQEFIEKPGRDIRVYVIGDKAIAASYRTSEHWITNAARGAVSVRCEITPEIEEIALKAKDAVGAILAGIDLMETPDGYSVIEVNTGAEFKGLMSTTDIDIPAEIVEETMRVGRQFLEARQGAAYVMSIDQYGRMETGD